MSISTDAILKSPVGHQIRLSASKKINDLLPKAWPSERADVTYAVVKVAVSGGQRDEKSLDPILNALKGYERRCNITEAEHAKILGELVALYRTTMTLVGSIMEVFEPGWAANQVAAGGESVPINHTRVDEPGRVEVTVQPDNNPKH